MRRNKSQFALGFLFGAAVGGFALNRMSQGDGMFSDVGRGTFTALGVALGGGLGGAIGLAAGADTRYHIDKMSSTDRRKLLNRLFPGPMGAD